MPTLPNLIPQLAALSLCLGVFFFSPRQASSTCLGNTPCQNPSVLFNLVIFKLTTNSPTPILRGTAEPLMSLQVTVAGAVYETRADENSEWSVDTANSEVTSGRFRPELNGINEVVVQGIDGAGEQITDTTSGELLIDTSPPGIPEITRLISGDTTPVLSGKVDPDGVSSLSVAGATYFLQSQADGHWTLDLSLDAPVSGRYLPATNQPIDISVRTTDQAGNQSIDQTSKELTVRLDADFDGIANLLEGWLDDSSDRSIDSDGDGQPDYLDLDSDNDGLTDEIEAAGLPILSGLDSDLDNIDDAIDSSITGALDRDGDGIDDAAMPPDSDGDGMADFIDSDSDNDGISDQIEQEIDTDADGLENYRDTDSDNDGILDIVEGTADPDHDSIANYIDTDSDNDGIPDQLESGDHDGDMIPDRLDRDSDNDGISDLLETSRDTDKDGVADYLDLDSDNDEVPDLYESALPIGLLLTLDKNHYREIDLHSDASASGPDRHDIRRKGLHRRVDLQGVPGAAATLDTDSDGLPDSVDLDSDNDGIPDITEAGGKDSNLDGLTDNFIDINSNGLNDAIELSETVLIDSDHDHLADLRDLDSDNDGIPDLTETYGGPLEQKGNLQHFIDNNNDGLDDLIALSLSVPNDTDNDTLYDYLDADSNQNGLSDLAEHGFKDELNDGITDSLRDSDADSIPDHIDVDQTQGFDRDDDGIDDSADATFTGSPDSDNDGVDDAHDPDADGDGRADERLIMSAPTAAAAMSSASRSGGRGAISGAGCTLNGGAAVSGKGKATLPIDPLLPLLAMCSVLTLWFRQRFDQRF